MLAWHGNECFCAITIKKRPDLHQGVLISGMYMFDGLTRGVLPLALRAAVGGPKRQSCRFVEPVKASHPFQLYKRKRP